MTRRFVYACAALAAFGLAGPLHPNQTLSAQAPPTTALEADTVIERPLARAEEHCYALAMTAGEAAHVIVEQQGVDVIVDVHRADGTVIATFDDDIRSRGREQIDVVADTTGTYTIAIKAARGMRGPGGYAIRTDSRGRATEADRSEQESRTLRTAAAEMDRLGQFSSASAALERALHLTEAARGPDDLQTAAVAVQLAAELLHVPDDAKAEALFARALSIMDRTLGPDHPSTAVVRSRLGLLYQKTGQRPKAEITLRQALDTIEKTIGTQNRWFVAALTTVGSLRDDAGDFEQASETMRRAMSILEQIDDTQSGPYAGLLNNLGQIYRQKEDYARAEDLFQRSLTIAGKALGEDSYALAITLQNLGIVAREHKDYAAAQAYYARALSIRERSVGPDHPDVAQVLNNIANIYRATGDFPKSLENHLAALRIWEKANGPYQQATILSVGNIARTYAAAGDLANAVAYQRRSDDIIEKDLALNLAVGSERQKLAFVRATSERTDRTLSLHLNLAPDDPEACILAAQVLLQRKGRVLDAMTDTFAVVRERVPDPKDRELLDRLKATTARLARLALNPPELTRQEERQVAIKDLETRKERLESELSEHSVEFRAAAQPVTLAAVQAAVPEDAALLEFAIFRPFYPKAERNGEAYGPAHYAAYILRRHAAPHGLDLGPAAAIDEAIESLRESLRDPSRTDVKEHARALAVLVMQPLRPWIGNATRLLVSPDGELNLVPFDALVDDRGGYLIERYATSYLSSGRDLLRMQVPRRSGSAPVILADPLFGEPPVSPVRSIRAAPANAPLGGTRGSDLSTVYFAPLAASAAEARAIKALFPDATLLTGRLATKATLQRVEAPRMLHIASHGFFLGNAASERAQPSSPADGARPAASNVGVDNPLLRSGIALAGANVAQNARDDGILTALEASSLNLWGTKLVTLSACDTGVGEVRNGEGVYGLRRAFVLAGTETLVMSLWSVSDYVARETMVVYYTGLRAGLGRGDALRQAKLALLRRKTRQHPFYWASFIQSGEWASLGGRR
ncbi:MAG TPA: CHAT domain-containing tetratricopeptide repeat protein [Vicinamibacterales bacterium]|nr:CHAT domain-containing tetratricopeptide repeat protein [Vicinamibacterales bacterium]